MFLPSPKAERLGRKVALDGCDDGSDLLGGSLTLTTGLLGMDELSSFLKGDFEVTSDTAVTN